MADIWDAKYNLLTVKPEIDDRIWIGDKDANEQKVMEYSVLKSFFVKTDEATNIEAVLEFQSTITKPNSILKFGSAGEFHIYSDGTDLFMKGTNAAGKLRFYANSAEMLTLNPVNDSIATHGNVINYDGAAGKGLKFAITTNNARFTEQLNCESLFVAENGIGVLLNNISYTGFVNTGLEFDASNHARFKQNLNVDGTFQSTSYGRFYSTLRVDGTVDINDDVALGDNYIGYSGANGLKFNASNNASFSGALSSVGLFTAVNNISGLGTALIAGQIRTNDVFNVSGSAGITFNGAVATLNIKGGIIVGKT